MIKRAQHGITKAEFDSIRRVVSTGNSIRIAAEAHGVSWSTASRVCRAKSWEAYLEWKKAYCEKMRIAEARRRAAAKAKTAEIEVIQNPDAPPVQPEQISITDEFHEHRPRPLESLEFLGLPKQICQRIHALSKYPAAVEIIGKAVVLCPESIGSLVNTLYFPLFGVEEIE